MSSTTNTIDTSMKDIKVVKAAASSFSKPRSSSITVDTVSSTEASSRRSSSPKEGEGRSTIITPKLIRTNSKGKKNELRNTLTLALGGGGSSKKGSSSRSSHLSRKQSDAARAAIASFRTAEALHEPTLRKKSPPKVTFSDQEMSPEVVTFSDDSYPESIKEQDVTFPAIKIHARVDGPLVMIGFGSIGRGILPLIERHIAYDKTNFTVIEPTTEFVHILNEHGVKHLETAITAENYEPTLRTLFPAGGKQGMIVNLSVDVDSVAVMCLAQELGVLYIDTVIEPWPGIYFDSKLSNAERTNYALRERMRETAKKFKGGVTAVSSCGANPGMVSWFMKEALTILATETGGILETIPKTKDEWANLAMTLGVKGIHIAERDTQISTQPKQPGVFTNTWSCDGFLSEGFQPAELGWGTHEKVLPAKGYAFEYGESKCGIYIDRPGGDTRVKSWVPGVGPQMGLLVTHNEALSISDYYTVRDADDNAIYRPTCHYAYHPCNDAVLSLYETNGAGILPEKKHILTADEILSGNDDLGVLLYGHSKGAMWYGSRLSIDETRKLAPYQNATGMQVTSAVLAGMVWAIENPTQGFVEADEMDHVRCLEVQRPYLGSVECHYTDWTPLSNRINKFEEDIDNEDVWQFKNFLAV